MTHTLIPQTVLTVPLQPTHRITLYFLFPPLIHLVVFTFELATSIAFCWCLITRAKVFFLMGIIIFLIFLPALVTATAILIRGSKDDGFARKVAFTILVSLAFPVWTIYRLTIRIFWAIDAMLIFHRQGTVSDGEGANKPRNTEHKWGPRGEEVEEALNYSIDPSSTELYLFLRAFLFSLPNAFLNIVIILAGLYDVDFAYETYRVEAASIIFSLVYLSMTAAYYQHFESQHLIDRDFPWRGKTKREKVRKDDGFQGKLPGGEEEEKGNITTVEKVEYPMKETVDEHMKEIVDEHMKETEDEPMKETVDEPMKETVDEPMKETVDEPMKETVDEPMKETVHEAVEELKDETGDSEKDSLPKAPVECSETDDEKLKKQRYEHSAAKSSPPSSPSSLKVILRHPQEIPDSEKMGTYQGFYRPVPNEPAPPPPRTRPPRIPGGFRDIFCDSVSTTVNSVRVSREQSFRSTLFAWPPQFKPFRQSVQSNRENPLPLTPMQGAFPALPTRTTKKASELYGMERDDAIGLCVSFAHWLLLLIARAVSLGTAFNYFPKPTAGICAAHIIVVTLWLLRREGPPYLVPSKLALRFGLAIVSVSGVFIELGGLPYGPKAPILHEALVFIEDFALGLGWILSGINDSWWHSYTFYMSIGCHILSMSCALMYLIALRPRKHLILQEEKEITPLLPC